MFVTLWNTLKAGWSRLNDWIMGGAPRATIPTFASPEAAATYLLDHARYTGDKLGGAGDNYIHPVRFQAAMNAGPEALLALPLDCDDYATWAHQALLTVQECEPQLFTLRDAGVVGSHVVCAYRWRTRFGVIDTNGHRLLPSLDPATLCRVFSEIYASRGYRYVEAVATPYPF